MIKVIQSVNEIKIDSVRTNWLLLDVDQTIISPLDFIANQKFQYYKIFDVLKELNQQRKISNQYLDRILNCYRKNRTESLIEKKWVSFFKNAHSSYAKIYGLTALQTGYSKTLGQTLESWRFDILSDLSLGFSDAQLVAKLTAEAEQYASFYKGIMQTGKYSKSESLNFFLTYAGEKPEAIIFVDDKLSNLEELSEYCLAKKIDYQGYHYQGMHHFKQEGYNDELAFKQLEILLKKGLFVKNAKLKEFVITAEKPLISGEEFQYYLDSVC